MGKRQGSKGKKGGSSTSSASSSGGSGFLNIDVDPRRVRFAHSKIKPLFSGCGRTIDETLTEIRQGTTSPGDLPAITVIRGQCDAESGEPWFFSLNNRRLYVLKVCREEGLLGSNGLVRVRCRDIKSHEQERYTVEKCALQARFMYAITPGRNSPSKGSSPEGDRGEEGTKPSEEAVAGKLV